MTFALYLVISLISLSIEYDIPSTGNLFDGLFLYADLELFLGAIFGVIYTLKNRESEQPILKFGIFVGIIGGIFTSLVISIYETVLYAVVFGLDIIFFLLFFVFLALSGGVTGLLGGALVSSYYLYKDMKSEKDDDSKHLNDDFFDDLIEK